MKLTEMNDLLKKEIKQSRFEHSINVMSTAVALAKIWGCDVQKAAVAGLLHDCAREVKGTEAIEMCNAFDIKMDDIEREQTVLLHGPIGARFACNKYKIEDKEITDAIACHTTGRAQMSMLDKIIFLSDFIEPKRNFRGVEKARKLSKTNINEAVLYCLNNSIMHLISNNSGIHCNTINARNYMIEHKNEF
ncbi:MAG: bis(5'-nucleosyl)-tetraphosphatase (symmetrical) YqeK [Clostridia bacterium]|jgi:predicted HD superfamily hydrolase involved in NAD metabolism